MTMFLIQSLLWLLAAFFLGYGLGRWLKGIVCKHREVETQTQLETQSTHLRVPVTTAAVAAGTAATAALARSREPVKPTVSVKEPEIKAPIVTAKAPELKTTVTPLKAEIELPKVEVKAPTVSVTVPTVDLKAPEVDLPKLDVNLPKVDVKLPAVDLPKVELDVPPVDVNLPKMQIHPPEVDVDLPKLDIDLPKAEVKAPLLDLPKVDVEIPTIDLPKVDVSLPKIDMDLPQVDVNLPKVDLSLPKADVEIPTIDLPKAEVNLPEVDTPKLEVKDIAAGVVGLGAAALGVVATKIKAPDGDIDLTVSELVKPPEVDVDLKTLHLEVPESKANLSAVEWHDAKASVDAVTVNVPDVAVDLPEAKLPNMDLGLAAANIHTPEGKTELTALHVDVPATSIHLPDAGIEREQVKVGAGLVELNTPDGLYTVEGAKVEALDSQEIAAALRLTKPDGNVQLAGLATDPNGQVSLATLDKTASGVELQSFELGTMQTGLVNSDWLASLKAAALAQGNSILAGAAEQALAKASPLSSFDIGSIGGGLSADLLDTLKKAAVGVGVGAVAAKATEGLAGMPKPVDESDLIEVGKTLSDDWERGVETDAVGTNLPSQVPAQLASLGTTASTHTTVKEVLANTVEQTLAAQPKPVDESDVIEAGKNVAEAVLNPRGLSVTEIGSLGQGLNTDALTSLKLTAAGAATVAAVQANLQSGAQPMIVDESDAIEAIKLAWDGELSPAELAALEHTLILRPGETGRLGLVTCSVPGTNCVSLGGLEGDLSAGDAMRSNLFNMAVTHNDDGNYVFSSLSKWLPDWIKSGDFSEHTDELANLVWDNDPKAVEHAAGYQLTLREGQYGDLGLVSCAVNETGSVSLGGIVGSIAEGQTAVSKLYGIFVERAGDVYTFKQFSKPKATGSWVTNAQAAVAAVGAGMAAQANAAVDAVQEIVLPVTKSQPTDRLEPDLAWTEDKLRINLQRLIEESHDRRGSKLVSQLWDSDSGYDCGVLEGEESLVLKPGLYGKLGSVHCGVTKPGRVVVSGDVSALAEGEGVLFHLYNIVVCRDDEDNYRFERLRDLV